MTDLSKKRSEAGKRGGLATLRRCGQEYFKQLGRKGAKVFHLHYKLEPVGINDFAIVHRETGEVKAFLSGMPF
jgi:hypothetical protein